MSKLALLFALARRVSCCSYVEVPIQDAAAPNGTRFAIGRTMELGNDGGSADYFSTDFWQVRVHPRNMSLGKLGFVSVDMSGLFPTEGMNEAGLTMSTQTLRGSVYEAEYASFEADVTADQLMALVLRNCADINEAMAWVSGHRVVAGSSGVHWALADAAGRSIVIEYLKGQRVVYENTPRVLTNDPPLDWHWRNLNTYVNLNPSYPHQNDFIDIETSIGHVPRAIGHGWNLFGLPGDGSPPSRFVQLFYQRGYSLHRAMPRSSEDAIVLATGLLNKVFIPLGSFAADEASSGDMPEYTPWSVIKIPSEKRLLFRGYRNLRWQQVDLTRLDFAMDPSVAPHWPVEPQGLDIDDVTERHV